MKKNITPLFCLVLMLSLSGCGLVEGAFKAGLIFGLLVVFIIGLIIYLSRMVIKQLTRKHSLEINKNL